MKKKYIQPTTKLHIVGVHQMLCGSPTAPDVDGTPTNIGDGGNLGKDDFDYGW